MIDKSRIIETVMERLKKLAEGHFLILQTYKRNRCVMIVKHSEEELLIIEDGFFKDRFIITRGKFKKTLKGLLKKEFPRSRKIRLHMMGKFAEEKVLNQDWKVL